jgi:hypothetical protein
MPLSDPSGRYHISEMATYTISPGTEHGGFDVAIVGSDGTRQTMLGFKTHAAAEAWIAEEERRANVGIQSGFRTQWRF